jgi:hypothetical protein
MNHWRAFQIVGARLQSLPSSWCSVCLPRNRLVGFGAEQKLTPLYPRKLTLRRTKRRFGPMTPCLLKYDY